MGMPEKSTPFGLLLEIDQLYAKAGVDLPEQIKLQASTWTGIGFRLGEYHLVISIHHLEEILTEPVYTPVPIVQSWMKGVANMRGHLLPVMDLNKLFDVPSKSSHKQRRVMAVKNADGGYVGFLVDAVYGMQHFSSDSQLVNDVDVPESLLPFVTGAYQGEHQKWLFFNTEVFMESSQFLQLSNG